MVTMRIGLKLFYLIVKSKYMHKSSSLDVNCANKNSLIRGINNSFNNDEDNILVEKLFTYKLVLMFVRTIQRNPLFASSRLRAENTPRSSKVDHPQL